MPYYETKDRAIQEYLETPSKCCIFVQFEARPRESDLQIYQTRSNAVLVCIEKAVRMKTTDELYQKDRLTPRASRVVLKSNT